MRRLNLLPLLLVFLLPLSCERCERPKVAPPAVDAGELAAPTVPQQAVPEGALLAGPQTYGVIAGVLVFSEAGVAGWPAKERKDRELYELLLARGVPAENLELLLDQEVTKEKLLAALSRVAKKAPAGSTLFFYYAGHGSKDDGGAVHFLAHDTKSGDLAGTGIALTAIGSTIEESFGGERAVLMADCCYSGSLAGVADSLSAHKKIEAISLTSAEASNLSTSNWTFTQAVIDGLRGDRLNDRDGDGTLRLDELGQAVAGEMRFRERQRHGFRNKGADPRLPVALATGAAAGAATGPFAAGEYLRTVVGAGHRTVRVRAPGAEESLVRFFDYSSFEDRRVKNADLAPITFERYPVGSKLRVYWGGDLYDAEVLKAEGDFHRVTYPGWDASHDEWVMSDRIAGLLVPPTKATATALVEVEWSGQWWPATILEEKGQKLKIHYVGYDASWDEWIGPKRLRRLGDRQKPGAVGEPVQVEWRGQWWPAAILQKDGPRYLIRYDGYGTEWDEWVGEARIRRG